MKATFYEIRLSHIVVTEKGQDKVIKETIITNDEFLTAAIGKVDRMAIEKGWRDHRVLGGKLSTIKEVHDGPDEKIFKAVIEWVLEVNEKGVKKTEKYPIILTANDFTEAKIRVEVIQVGIISDWNIKDLTESGITGILI